MKAWLSRVADRIAAVLAWLWRQRWRILLVLALLIVALALWLWWFLGRDEPQTFDDPVQHFKYGSTGGDRVAGIPVGIWKGLPRLCAPYFGGDTWEALGFNVEPGMDRPVGTTMRRTLGLDRVFLNCAACHSGTWRADAAGPRTLVVGMPANRLNLARFARGLGACAADERFNPWQVVQAAEDAEGRRYSTLEKYQLYLTVPAIKEFLILARHRFRFFDREPESGPGRFDTFNPAKALLNWPLDDLPDEEMVGNVDFPSVWLQGQRKGMRLHWDGNNDSVEERNRSASFGSGGVPTTLDRPSLTRIAAWLRDQATPPPWPFAIDEARAARGKQLYGEYCAACHGASGRDFSGAFVGKVEPIGKIRTDPCRLDNYTYALAVEQGNLYAAYPDERFRRFRKTHGYANMPLDGLWLRAPYLHNGSVPTVRDLLEPAEKRPAVFYRGNDVIDRDRLGFVASLASQGKETFFRYETRCIDSPDRKIPCGREQNPENRHDANRCVPGPWAGNSNRGHDGPEYGTDLAAEDKDAIVEYLKTF
jgi:cytochrome c2